MNWEAIGALGEIIGSLAVFITLVYLAIQIRQNTKAIRAAANQGAIDRESNTLVEIIHNPDIWLSITKPELTDEEVVRLHAMLALIVRNHEHYWGQYQLGAIDRATLERFEGSLKAVFSFRRTKNWWKRQVSFENTEFNQRLNELLLNLPEHSESTAEVMKRMYFS